MAYTETTDFCFGCSGRWRSPQLWRIGIKRKGVCDRETEREREAPPHHGKSEREGSGGERERWRRWWRRKMASCNLGGILNVKLLTSYDKAKCTKRETLNGIKCGMPEVSCGISVISLRQKPAYFSCLVRQPWRSPKPFVVSCSSSQTQRQAVDISEEKKSISEINQTISSSEVQSLLTNICDTTSIAEFKLNLGGFRLYVKRDLDGNDSCLPPTSPPIQIDTSNLTPDSNGSASSTSLAISKPEPSPEGIQSFLDAASDEGLVMLPSPKVGLFRRSKTIKGKRAPPPCKEKQEVKEGQVLCYIEQLGGEIPIESDVSGEVVKILRRDGEPVGYGDALIAILPSFPGIKKLQLPA